MAALGYGNSYCKRCPLFFCSRRRGARTMCFLLPSVLWRLTTVSFPSPFYCEFNRLVVSGMLYWVLCCLVDKYWKTIRYNFACCSIVHLYGDNRTVLKAQEAPKEEKGMWMHRHKSLGLLAGMIVLPRVAYRLGNMAAVRYMRVIFVVDDDESRVFRWISW